MSFAQPGWLALLILIPLLGIGAVLTSRLRRKQWEEFVAPRLRAALLKRGSSLPRWLALFFLLAACSAIIVAIARPQGDAGVRTETTLGRNLLIALDLSRSMRVSDVKPDRLSQAKVIIYELLEAMPNERVGLIGFAGSAYVYAPLTIDHSAVRETVDQIDENWTTQGGSNLAEAVKLAIETLKKTGQKNNALVIISDGEKHDGDLDAMIAEAERSGVYILAVGVGTEDGGFVPNADFPGGQMVDRGGRPIVSRLQADVMRQLAAETKGRFALAGSGFDIPSMAKSVVKDLDAFEMAGRERKVSIEFYQWLILPAVFFLIVAILAGTRWRGMQASLLIGSLFLFPSEAHASAASKAKEALNAGRHEEARDAYQELAGNTKRRETAARYRLGEGTAAYRAADFRGARSAFSMSLLSDDPVIVAQGHLGIGNSLFQLGWQGLADEAYPSDAESLPDLDRFDTLVKERLAKLRETEAPANGETNGYVRIESMITNWVDAVRHFASSQAAVPKNKEAIQNRELTLIYLERLRELLEEEEQETEESMPQPQPGEGQPQEGEGEEGEGEPQEGEGEGDEEGDGEGDEGDEERDGKSGENEQDQNKGPRGEEDSDEESDEGEQDPNESPEDRARRLLKENADLEKGPLNPGRREFRDPDKDW